MTECQEVGEPAYAMTLIARRPAFADLGTHAGACHPEAEDENGEQVVLIGWVTTRQAGIGHCK